MSKTLWKKLVLTLSLTLPIISLNNQEALARNLNFKFHNHTGKSIHELYVSASNRRSWEEDILGADILPAGQDMTINIPDTFGTCFFDIKVVFTGGFYIEKSGFNLCQLTDITVP